jgi:O-6-methylguanine DNA methyltransferase
MWTISVNDRAVILEYEFFDGPFGEFMVVRSDRGIRYLEFIDRGRQRHLAEIAALNPEDRLARTSGASSQPNGSRFFDVNQPGSLPIDPVGTDFQRNVWTALCEIPMGETLSYRDFAIALGRPRAARAVARAIASNRIGWLIPCHRIIRSDGQLGGYRWGTARKSALLRWERRYVPANSIKPDQTRQNRI